MTKDELAAIRERCEKATTIHFGHARDEMQWILCQDIPALLAEVERLSKLTRWYPIQGETHGFRVPFDVMLAFEKQADRNHGQSISHLAKRGGLCIRELWGVVKGVGYREVTQVSFDHALKELREMLPQETEAEIERLKREVNLALHAVHFNEHGHTDGFEPRYPEVGK